MFDKKKWAREYNKKYHATHKDEENERCRKYYRDHADERRANAREWHKNNRERALNNCRSWWLAEKTSVPENRVRRLVSQARSRAAVKGIKFDESLFAELTTNIRFTCPCCGSEIKYNTGRGRTERNNSPSIDRIDPSLGYVSGNVAIICWKCNRQKNDSSINDIKAILFYMESHALAPTESSLPPPSA